MKNISERVMKAIHECTGLPPDGWGRETSLRDDIGADSLDLVELELALEEEFGCEVDDDTTDAWETIGDVIDWIEERQAS